MEFNLEKALAALRALSIPTLDRDLVSLGLVRDVVVASQAISLRLIIPTALGPQKDSLKAAIEGALKGAGANEVRISADVQVQQAPPQQAPRVTQDQRMPGVKAVIAVAAGKGGVGKSTVSTNLAIALSKLGKKVGILDADIYGPSLHIMLGLQGVRPTMTPEDKIAPVQRYGLSVMSMGFMLAEAQAVVWRGPMLGKALQQFIEDVEWGELDAVIIDMPPGTGDVQLSLAQYLPVAGAVIVTTPQDVAFADVRRAIDQLEKTHIPIVGVVENMAGFTCGNCGSHHAIFGESRISTHCDKLGLELMGQIALDSVTALAADKGEPITIAAPDSAAAQAYMAIARRVSEKVEGLSEARVETANKFQSFFNNKPS